MRSKAPTYFLDPDLLSKLDYYIQNGRRDGLRFFSKEFANIDNFVARATIDQDNRDDQDVRRSPKEKYLSELIAYRTFDLENREAFNRTRKTLIVMPHCISLDNPDCQKTETKVGEVCRNCVSSCQAFQIGELAQKYRLKIIFSKKYLTWQLEHFKNRMKDMGVIGIACILMLADGMRAAAKLGIPARGVLLNYCGCDHWNDNQFASAFTMSTLESILEEKYGPRIAPADH
jgi:hypothetical protein